MKKITCLLAALLLMCGLTWAQQITWTAADQGYENGQVIESVDFNDYVAGEFFKGTNNNNPKYYTTGAAIRCYGGNYFTITSDYVLTEIVFGFASGEGTNAITSDVGTYENGTWTGSANEVTFTIGGTNGHRRFATFTITYDEGGNPAPIINASNVEIAYDATEGAIGYTISNPAEDGVLSAETEAEWLTIGTVGETVPFTCTVNDNGERVATVTLTYTYETDQTVTKNVTVTQVTNPNGPGSEANPYTVAQARAAIDAGTGTQGVYATGIVSEIVTAYNSQYSNVTFDIVDATGDQEYLRAYRCGGAEAANVAVGDVVVVSGNLTKYGEIYEFAQNCQVVSLTHPVITDPVITVTPALVEVDADEHDGTLDLTYENLTITAMTDFDIQYYNAEGQESETPDWVEVLVAEQDPAIGEGYVVSYYMIENEGEARSAYFKVYAMDDESNLVYSNLVTINQAEYVEPALDYAELPFAFNGGKADIEGTDGLTQEGLGSDYGVTNNPTTQLKFDHTGDWLLLHFIEAPGTLTFDIKGNNFSGGTFTVQTSEDGETYEDLDAYTELSGVETKTYSNLDENIRYIKWIYTQKSNGNVGLGDIHLYEVGGGPAPEASITVAPATVNAPAEGAEGTLAITYESIPDLIAFDIQFCDANGDELEGDDPEWIYAEITEPTGDEGYTVTYIIDANDGEARSAYFKVYTFTGDELEEVYSNLVTINQAAYVAPVLDYAELPFEFNGGRDDIEGTDGLTQEGLGSDYGSAPKLKFDGTGDWLLLHFNEVPGTLNFDIKGNGSPWAGTFTVQTSEDGETYEDIAEYTELGNTETKTIDNLGENVRYIKWIYTEKVSGNVGLGNITLAQPTAPVASITVAPATVNVDAEEHDGTLDLTYENLTITDMEDFDIQYYDAEGEEAETPDWIEVLVAEQDPEIGEGYVVSYYMLENDGEARTAYFKVYAIDDETNLVYSNLVTINQAEYVAPVDEQQFALFGGNLVEGDYIIYYNGKAMNNVVSSGRLQYAEIEPEANVITTDNAAIVWHIAPNDEGYWTIYSADANAYAASTGVKNKAQMLEDGTDDMAMWTVTEISGTYEFVNKANAAGDVNANLRNNGTYGFACYSTSTGGALSLYKYTETVVTYTKEIAGYGNSNGGYYLIASPVLAVTPTAENGFLTDAYDLYYFDQAGTDGAWINYETENNGINFFNIASGKGYLYASQENTTLTFTGMPYDGDGVIALDYVGDTTWNLIGNPYSNSATVSRDFYILNTNGSELELSEPSEVNPMQGIFVDAVTVGETVSFVEDNGGGVVPPTPGMDPWDDFKLNLRVSNGNGNSDFARIRFGEGRTLSKFMLNENNTKLYFTQGGNDYAVVRSEAEGEMPVNFKAAENGIYTLSINPENIEMDYLHLIDNMTGMDIDLLQTPDYSFEATVNDNAARFTLMFAGLTGIEENNEQFAFFSNGNLIVNNEGEATLQVIDMNGRMVKNQTINGNASVNMGATAGVYMLRLVNGDNVMVQKVVVK